MIGNSLNWQALEEWALKHPHSTITIEIKNGFPDSIISPTTDGIGTERHLIAPMIRAMLKETDRAGK